MEYGISGYQSDYRFIKKDVVELEHEVVNYMVMKHLTIFIY